MRASFTTPSTKTFKLVRDLSAQIEEGSVTVLSNTYWCVKLKHGSDTFLHTRVYELPDRTCTYRNTYLSSSKLTCPSPNSLSHRSSTDCVMSRDCSVSLSDSTWIMPHMKVSDSWITVTSRIHSLSFSLWLFSFLFNLSGFFHCSFSQFMLYCRSCKGCGQEIVLCLCGRQKKYKPLAIRLPWVLLN